MALNTLKRKTKLFPPSQSPFAFASIGFLSFFVFGMMASCITSVTQHFPGFAQSVGFDASLGALLLSAGMVGNIVFKIVIGVLSDRLGALKATLVTLVINMAGIFLLLTGLSSGILLLGAFFFGSVMPLVQLVCHF